jgi:hypothetical protein
MFKYYVFHQKTHVHFNQIHTLLLVSLHFPTECKWYHKLALWYHTISQKYITASVAAFHFILFDVPIFLLLYFISASTQFQSSVFFYCHLHDNQPNHNRWSIILLFNVHFSNDTCISPNWRIQPFDYIYTDWLFILALHSNLICELYKNKSIFLHRQHQFYYSLQFMLHLFTFKVSSFALLHILTKHNPGFWKQHLLSLNASLSQ